MPFKKHKERVVKAASWRSCIVERFSRRSLLMGDGLRREGRRASQAAADRRRLV